MTSTLKRRVALLFGLISFSEWNMLVNDKRDSFVGRSVSALLGIRRAKKLEDERAIQLRT
jgi:hypothetical protein